MIQNIMSVWGWRSCVCVCVCGGGGFCSDSLWPWESPFLGLLSICGVMGEGVAGWFRVHILLFGIQSEALKQQGILNAECFFSSSDSSCGVGWQRRTHERKDLAFILKSLFFSYSLFRQLLWLSLTLPWFCWSSLPFWAWTCIGGRTKDWTSCAVSTGN